MENQKLIVIENANVPAETPQSVLAGFKPFFDKFEKWRRENKVIEIISEDQKEDIKKAREGRLELKKIRTEANTVRKELKEDSLRTGKAIDGMMNVLKELVEPEEKRLEKQENFVKLLAEERKRNLQLERSKLLSEYTDNVPENLCDMDADTFGFMLSGAKDAFEKKLEAEALAEKQRLAAIEAENAEQERIKAENEKMRLETIEKQKEIDRQKVISGEIEAYAMEEKRVADLEIARVQEESAEKERIAEQARLAEVKKQEEEKAKLEATQKAELEKANEKARLEAIEKQKLIDAESERKASEAEEGKRLKAREQDQEHRKVINNGILVELAKFGVDEENGKALIIAIAKGKINNVSIIY